MEKYGDYKKINVNIELIDHFVEGNRELKIFLKMKKIKMGIRI